MQAPFGITRDKAATILAGLTARPSVGDVQSVVDGTRSGAIISAINAICYALLCTNQSNLAFMGPWLAATLALCFVILRRSNKAKAKSIDYVSARANRRLILFTCLFALPWASLAFYVLGLQGSGDDFATILVCTGMSTGGVFMLYRTMLASLAYYLTILSSVVISAFISNHPSFWPILAYSLSYGCFLTLFASSTGKTARDRDRSNAALSDMIIDLRKARDENHRLANQDVVTALPNRKFFTETLQAQIEQARQTGKEFTLLCLDLDRFKNINDVYGHAVGDKLLALCARRLVATVGMSDVVARIGGDEFAILLRDVADPPEITHIAGQIIAHLSQPARIDGLTLHSGTSIGAAVSSAKITDPAQILSKADLALNKAKEAGRRRVVLFDDGLRKLLLSKDRLETALRAALDNRDITVAYQPKVRLKDSTMMGAEALVRWTDPELGPIPPDHFLPIAAERALLPRLSHYIANHVARDIIMLKKRGANVGKIALNIHPSDLKSPDTLLKTIDHLESLGVTHHDIMLEITEGCFIGRGTDRSLFILDALAERGIELSLDDFGTGHASLTHLKKLPVSEIKIDRSFVGGLRHNTDDRAIVSAIAEIARGKGIRAIAEGVETEDQRDILQTLGVEIGQGFLWSKAVSAKALADLSLTLPLPGRETG